MLRKPTRVRMIQIRRAVRNRSEEKRKRSLDVKRNVTEFKFSSYKITATTTAQALYSQRKQKQRNYAL